jgi:hypothetical protein
MRINGEISNKHHGIMRLGTVLGENMPKLTEEELLSIEPGHAAIEGSECWWQDSSGPMSEPFAFRLHRTRPVLSPR